MNALGNRIYRLKRGPKNRAVVLLLHEVDDRQVLSFNDSTNTSPEHFLRLIERLTTEYAIIRLQEMFERLSNDSIDRPYLSLTFDDGAVSSAINTYLILKSRGITATIFLTTDCLGDKKFFWPYVYTYLLHSEHQERFLAICRTVYNNGRLTGGNLKRYTNLAATKTQVGTVMNRVFEEIMSFEEYKAKEGRLFLNRQEIVETSDVIDYGIHTASHTNLGKLSDDEVRREFRDSM